MSASLHPSFDPDEIARRAVGAGAAAGHRPEPGDVLEIEVLDLPVQVPGAMFSQVVDRTTGIHALIGKADFHRPGNRR